MEKNTKYQEAVLVAKTTCLKDKQHGLPASFRGYSEHFRLIAFKEIINERAIG